MERLVEKKTGTYADALEAIGLASLLEELGFRGVQVQDEGPFFRVSAGEGPSPEWWPAVTPGYPYIWERSKEPDRPDLPWVLDYEDARQRREAWSNFHRAQRRAGGRPDAPLEEQGLEPPPEPPPEVDMAAILASMRMTWNADRELAKWLQAHPDAGRSWIRSVVDGTGPAPKETPSFSNTQVLNPVSGKGVSAPKTRLRSPNSLPKQLVDPFREWLKLRGMWRAMLPYPVDGDFKFYVLEPGAIGVGGLETVRKDLRSLNLRGGVQLDIEATLRCTEILVRHSDVVQGAEAGGISLRRLTPRSVITGFRQAYFKSLGKAAALMNEALMPLPDWFRIDGLEDAEDYLKIIEEAIGSTQGGRRTSGCLGMLRENRSDDGRILQQYRQWLLTGDLFELLEFHHSFAVAVMQRLGAKDWARPFSTAILDSLLLKAFGGRYPMREIIENRGFQSIARAVRNCTIYAVRLGNRDVRFGLAQKWKQKIRSGKQDFVEAVAEFVQDQNWEVTSKLKGRGHMVRTEDLDAVIALIEEHGVELVGSLLLAYGYASAPRQVEENEPETAVATGQN